MEMKSYKNVSEYIDSFSGDVQSRLKKIRLLIQKVAPTAQEMIRYGMPAYKLSGKPFIYFAAFKNHIGFYPTPSGVKMFQKELREYKTSKGAIQLPLTEMLPVDLIKKIVQFRVRECDSLFGEISAPARRALASAQIKTLKDLSKWTEKELLEIHGMGPSTLPALRKILKKNSLSFTIKK